MAKARRVYLTSKRAHQETMEALAHLHELAHENAQAQEFTTHLLRRTLRKVGKLMTAYEDLTREVAETREVIMAKLAEMQAEIDIIKANPADVAAVTAAAAALDQLQSDITGAVPPPAEPPVEPVP